jgi:hypothetical protein
MTKPRVTVAIALSEDLPGCTLAIVPLDRFGHLLFDVRLGDVAASSRPRAKLVLPRGLKSRS